MLVFHLLVNPDFSLDFFLLLHIMHILLGNLFHSDNFPRLCVHGCLDQAKAPRSEFLLEFELFQLTGGQ